MDIYQKVLRKAKNEGKIDPDLLLWDNQVSDQGKQKKSIVKNVAMPPQLLMLEEDVLDDFHRTIENIHIEAEKIHLQVIGITSPVAVQGTSTFTAILSLIMAAIEKTYENQIDRDGIESHMDINKRKPGVLLIDTQLRNPSLHDKLEVVKEGGIIEILENDFRFKKGIKKVKNSSLKFISSGENKDFQLKPNHLKKLKAYLDILKTKIDYVILDIPPLLQYPEGIALSKLCDAIILVVQAGEAKWEIVQEARRLLERAEVNIMGSILNRRKFYIPNWAYKNL